VLLSHSSSRILDRTHLVLPRCCSHTVSIRVFLLTRFCLLVPTVHYAPQPSAKAHQTSPLNAATARRPEILADVASIKRTNEMEVVSHYNIRRVVDIYAAVQGRDLGAVGREVTRIVDANRKSLPRGSFITVRGQLQTMRTS